MGKLLVLIVLAVIAVWLLKRALLKGSQKEPAQKPAIEGDLVACARCGVNLPRNEARAIGEDLFCSDEHARLGKP